MQRRFLLPATIIAGVAGLGAIGVFAASPSTTIRAGDSLTVRCDGTRLSSSRVDAKTFQLSCTGSAATTTTVAQPPSATVSPPAGGSQTMLGGCSVFPADNAWNKVVTGLAVDANSTNYINAIQNQYSSTDARRKLHPDFGSDPTYGIPFDIVPANQANVPITFTAFGGESDPGPYPIPPTAHVEAGSDRHVLVLQQGTCKLYEMYNAVKSGSGWNADSGAVFNLNSNALRPAGWTSADAAGLPILAGLVRYDEVKSGKITHALRFTVRNTQHGYIAPATHLASSSTNANHLPMGARLRLKPTFDTSTFHGDAKVILEALKTYGMIVADNGSDWYISGQMGVPWNDNDLNQLKAVPGSAFEVLQTGPITKN